MGVAYISLISSLLNDMNVSAKCIGMCEPSFGRVFNFERQLSSGNETWLYTYLLCPGPALFTCRIQA